MSNPNRRLKPYPSHGARRGSEDRALPWEMSLTGDLGDKQSDFLDRLIEQPRRSRGIIYFDSCGGAVYAGLAIATALKLRGLLATGIVLGECSSAALLPFAACQRRYVTPQATLLFHPIRWQSEEDVRLEEAAEWTRHFQKLEADVDELLVKFLQCEPEVVRSWTHPGRFVSGTELVEAGLAQQVDLFNGDIWQQIGTA